MLFHRSTSERSGGRAGLALVREVVGQLAERDHRDEDEPDDEHREDDLAALFCGVREDQERSEHRPVTLPHQAVVRATCSLDGVSTCGPPRGVEQRRSIAAIAQVGSGGVERALAEEGRSRRPGRSLTPTTVCTRLGAEGDQLREIVHRADAPGRRDADEAVGVEIVPEEKGGVRVGGSKQAGATVVQEIALVDRLDTEREGGLAEAREDRRATLLVSGKEGLPPERALRGRFRDERLPDRRRQLSKKSPTASIVLSISSSPWASETNMHSNCDGAR